MMEVDMRLDEGFRLERWYKKPKISTFTKGKKVKLEKGKLLL
jgi:hypothetical protein